MPEDVKKGTIAAAKANFPAIKDKLQLLRASGEVTHGVNLIPAPGHSPAQWAILFASGNEQLLHMANVVRGQHRLVRLACYGEEAVSGVRKRCGSR
jgi:hypothetical protein